MQIIPYITNFLLLFEWSGRQTEMDIRHLPIDTAFPTGVCIGPLYGHHPHIILIPIDSSRPCSACRVSWFAFGPSVLQFNSIVTIHENMFFFIEMQQTHLISSQKESTAPFLIPASTHHHDMTS